MSDLLSIGASGTNAYRAALAAISENISNADTPNYARRSIRMSESAVSTSTSAYYSPGANFGGVEIAGVVRATDPYLDARSEEHTSELQSLMRISYAVFCLKNKTPHTRTNLTYPRRKQKTHKIKQLTTST